MELQEIKEQLYEVISEEPGITWIEASKRIGYTPGDAWLAMSALRQEGRIKQNERGWKVVHRGLE
jgi:hypothetical protein